MAACATKFDGEVLAALDCAGPRSATYVIRNWLASRAGVPRRRCQRKRCCARSAGWSGQERCALCRAPDEAACVGTCCRVIPVAMTGTSGWPSFSNGQGRPWPSEAFSALRSACRGLARCRGICVWRRSHPGHPARLSRHVPGLPIGVQGFREPLERPFRGLPHRGQACHPGRTGAPRLLLVADLAGRAAQNIRKPQTISDFRGYRPLLRRTHVRHLSSASGRPLMPKSFLLR